MGEEMKPTTLEELMRHMCPDLTIGEIFEAEMEETKQELEEQLALQGISEHNNLKLLNSYELRMAILKEIHSIKLELEPRICEKINMLVKAAFIAGSETKAYGFYNLTKEIASKRKSKIIKSIIGGKAKKRNPLLIEAIKEIANERPGSTQRQIIAKLKRKASEGQLKVDGHDICFMKKGATYRGNRFQSDYFVFEPLKETKYREFKPISASSVSRYISEYLHETEG